VHLKRQRRAAGFRADLVAASRRGEAFDRTRGLPVSKLRRSGTS
jgi:hypothetical protein